MHSDLRQRPRFAPIRNLTPDRLARMLDDFERGYLSAAALAWDTIEKRDDTIKSVAPLDHAVGDGRLPPCERPFWNAQLRRDFDTRHAELQSKPETIHMKSITGNLGKNQIDLSDFPSRQQLLQELVAAKKTAGLTYDQAWNAAKAERPDLFEAMNSNF